MFFAILILYGRQTKNIMQDSKTYLIDHRFTMSIVCFNKKHEQYAELMIIPEISNTYEPYWSVRFNFVIGYYVVNLMC